MPDLETNQLEQSAAFCTLVAMSMASDDAVSARAQAARDRNRQSSAVSAEVAQANLAALKHDCATLVNLDLAARKESSAQAAFYELPDGTHTTDRTVLTVKRMYISLRANSFDNESTRRLAQTADFVAAVRTSRVPQHWSAEDQVKRPSTIQNFNPVPPSSASLHQAQQQALADLFARAMLAICTRTTHSLVCILPC